MCRVWFMPSSVDRHLNWSVSPFQKELWIHVEVLDHGKYDVTTFPSRRRSGAPVGGACHPSTSQRRLSLTSKSNPPAVLGLTVPLQLMPPPAPTACQGGLGPALPCSGRTTAFLGAASLLRGTCGFGTFCPSPWLSPLSHLPGMLRVFPVPPLSLGLPSLA